MRHQDFKAWFEGFCIAVGDAPTPEQWARLRQEVAKIDEPEEDYLTQCFKFLTAPATRAGVAVKSGEHTQPPEPPEPRYADYFQDGKVIRVCIDEPVERRHRVTETYEGDKPFPVSGDKKS